MLLGAEPERGSDDRLDVAVMRYRGYMLIGGHSQVFLHAVESNMQNINTKSCSIKTFNLRHELKKSNVSSYRSQILIPFYRCNRAVRL